MPRQFSPQFPGALILICLCSLFLTLPAQAQPPDLLPRAEKLTADKPTPSHQLALLEIRRAAQIKPAPFRPAALPRPGPLRDAILQSIAWRTIPLPATDRHNLDVILDVWSKAGGKSPWIPVLRLYSTSLAGDRAAFLTAAAAITEAPTEFPSAPAEKAHFDLLKELGQDDNSAGLQILSNRSFAPLNALLDLDRALTREIDLLQGTSRAADAKTFQTCRDRLRQAWLDISRHLVERLFALHTLGRDQDCDALLFATRDLPYLTDSSQLAQTLARLDRAQAWSLLIEPMLNSEIQLITAPPKFPTTQAASATQLIIEAKTKSIQTGISTYEGAVHLRAASLDITCDKLAVLGDTPASAKILSGAGSISIKGASYDLIQAENFTLTTDAGALTLAGNVRLTRNGKTQTFRTAHLSRTGQLLESLSLLDDFDAAPDIQAKLALLPGITATCPDADLPQPVAYLLALNILRPHLLWQEAAANAPDFTPDPWLRDDALQQLQPTTAKPTRVPTLLQRDLPIRLSVTLKIPAHPDIARARQLLQMLTTPALVPSAQAWLNQLSFKP